MAEKTIIWPGSPDRKYKYKIHLIGEYFKDSPGNYIFAKETSPGRWIPIYIGETDSLQDRLLNHEKMPCIKRHGGTHVHIHIAAANNEVRRAEELDLIDKWDPLCNKE